MQKCNSSFIMVAVVLENCNELIQESSNPQIICSFATHLLLFLCIRAKNSWYFGSYLVEPPLIAINGRVIISCWGGGGDICKYFMKFS